MQYNASLAITGAIRGTSKEKLWNELGIESLQLRRLYRKLCYFYKFYKHESPQYLFKLVPLRQSPYTTRNTENIAFSKTIFFPQLLLSVTILTLTFEMSEALALLKTISWILWGQPQIMFLNVKIIEELNFLQDLKIGQKFKHSFQDTLNPI